MRVLRHNSRLTTCAHYPVRDTKSTGEPPIQEEPESSGEAGWAGSRDWAFVQWESKKKVPRAGPRPPDDRWPQRLRRLRGSPSRPPETQEMNIMLTREGTNKDIE